MTESLTAPHAAYRRVTPRSSGKHELAREIEIHLIEAGDRPINVSDLCERFKINRCKLHRAFVDVHGIPPIAASGSTMSVLHC